MALLYPKKRGEKMDDTETYDIKGYRISRKKGTTSAYGIGFTFLKDAYKEQPKTNTVVNFMTERILPFLEKKAGDLTPEQKKEFLKKHCGVDSYKELEKKSIAELRVIERNLSRA